MLLFDDVWLVGVDGSGGVSGDDVYNLIFVNNTWYILLRLHQMLSERLLKIEKLAAKIAANEAEDKKYRREGTAEALRLKKPSTTDIEEYYPLFIDMVKNLLDGQVWSFHLSSVGPTMQ